MQSGAAAAGSAATATTGPGGPAIPAAPAAGRSRAADPRSYVPRGQRQRTPAMNAGAVRPGAHLSVQSQQQLARGTLGAVNGKGPAQAVGFLADRRAMGFETPLVIRPPGFGAAGRDRPGSLGFDELDTAGVRERLLRRIDDLDHVTMRTGGGELGDGAADLGDR